LILKNLNHYDVLIKKFNTFDNKKIYKNYFSPRHIIGNCCFLYDQIKPKTPQHFLDEYLNLANTRLYHDPEYIKRYGRTELELIELAKEYRERILQNYPTENITEEDCLDALIKHIIIETFDGKRVEQSLSDYLQYKGMKMYQLDFDDDSIYGIDMMGSVNGYDTVIQLKPHTTFLGNANQSLINDRLNFIQKEIKTKQKYPSVAYYRYILYYKEKNGNVQWLSKKTETGYKFLFNIDELINIKTGENLLTINDFKKSINLFF